MSTDSPSAASHGTAPIPVNFDGIEEAGNAPPVWWKVLFATTAAFSIMYMLHYHAGTPGRSATDRYAQAVAENMRLQFAEIGELQPDEATLVRMMNDRRWVRVGESVFRTHCASCHGLDGGGLVGPNLADEHFKNVRSIEDILRVVQFGAAAGAMPPWRDKLHLNEQILVSSYVAALRGTTPSSPRGPEGNPIPPWPEPVEEAEAAGGDAGAGS